MVDIQQNYYTPLVTEAQAESMILVNLQGLQVVFYATQTTHELRCRAYQQPKIFTLMQGVRHCHGFLGADGLAYIYTVMLDGTIKLSTFKFFGDPKPVVTDIPFTTSVVFLHVLAFVNDNYLMVMDDGTQLHLLTSRSPLFTTPKAQTVYMNVLNPEVYVNRPTVGIHPEDYHASPLPSIATVGVQVQTIATGDMSVGFFPVPVSLA